MAKAATKAPIAEELVNRAEAHERGRERFLASEKASAKAKKQVPDWIEDFWKLSEVEQISEIDDCVFDNESLLELLEHSQYATVQTAIYNELDARGVERPKRAVAVVEPQKFTTTEHLISLINEDHEAYKQIESQAAFHAVRMGLVLERIKRMLPHGQFEDWCDKNITVGKTHRWHFRKLALEFLKQLPTKENHRFSDWIDSADERQIEMDEPVKRFVGEKTQLELFDEFGISGPKNKKLLPAPVKTGKNLSAAENAALLARTAWAEIVRAIDHEQQSWLNLTDHEIEQLNDVIWPVAKMMNQAVKGKK